MTCLCAEYKELIRQYLSNELSSFEFQDEYINKFKNENRVMDEFLFSLLDELFGDVDMYTEEENLLMKNPDFYLDKEELRRKAKNIFDRLSC